MTDDDRATWPAILRAANAWRRAQITGRAWTLASLDDMVKAECIIAPSSGAPRVIVAQELREAADVWAGVMHAHHASAGAACDPDYYEAHDAHTERELLAGRVDADGRTWDGWPPIYTRGALERPDLLA